MPDYSETLAGLLDDAMRREGWSTREVAHRTGGRISHTLIGEIRRTGYVPSVELVVELALALGGDPNRWLDAARKPRFLRYVEENSRVTLPVALRAGATRAAEYETEGAAALAA